MSGKNNWWRPAGAKLEDWRHMVKWSQAEVAEKIGTAQPRYSEIERGLVKPTPEQAVALEGLTKIKGLAGYYYAERDLEIAGVR